MNSCAHVHTCEKIFFMSSLISVAILAIFLVIVVQSGVSSETEIDPYKRPISSTAFTKP